MIDDINNVYIYLACVDNLLNDEELFNKLYNDLPNYRKEKVDSLKLICDKCLSIGAFYLLNKACKSLEIDLNKEIIEDKNYSKPHFLNNDYKFNLSHSSSYVMCIISKNEVGCDIEEIRNIDLKIADKYYSLSELDYLLSRDSDIRLNEFFRLWTLKESYIKCIGVGLKGLKKAVISINDKSVKLINNDSNLTYYFGEIDIINNYKCSYCVETLNYELLNFIVNKIDII